MLESSHELGQHGDAAKEDLASSLALRCGSELEAHGDVERGRTLGRRAAREPIEAGFVGLGELAEACVTYGKRRDDLVGERDEVHGRDVDVEFFVVEVHEEDVGHKRAAVAQMSNHTYTGLYADGLT